MITLALASLRYRTAAFLATLLAVLLGCSILIACGGLFETAIRLDAAPQRLAGAPIVITGAYGFPLPDEESETVAYAERTSVDADLVDDIAAVSGVGSAIPDVSFAAVVIKDGAPLEAEGSVLSGHDWASAGLTPYTLLDGDGPRASGDVVLDARTADAAGVRAGDDVEIAVAGQPRTFTVSGVAQAGREVDASAIFFSGSDAERFAPRPGRADAIGVLPADGVDVDRLAQQLDHDLPSDVDVLTESDRGAAEFTGVDASFLPLILLSSIFGGMVIVVMALVVSATISLSVRQRQQELALLRASGATPKQVHRMVVAETMVVSGIGAVLGIPLGILMGNWIFALSADRGVVPAALEFSQGIIPFAAGAVLAMLVPWIASNFAALGASRTRPIQALAEASIPPVGVHPLRVLLAKVFAVATVGLAISTMFLDPETASAVGGPAVLTGAIAVGLLGPELIGTIVTRMSGVVRRVAGREGYLAVTNTRTRAVMFSAILTPLTLAVAIGLGNIYSQTTRNDAALDGHLEQLEADAVITSSTGGVASDLLAEIRDIPGVANASELVSSRGWIEQPYDGRGSDPWSFLGIDAQDKSTVYAVPVVAGSLRDLAGDTVALPEEQAADLGIGLGDRIAMRLGDGAQVEVEVVALLDSPAYYGSVVLPVDLLAPHTTAGLASQILVRAGSDVDTDELVEQIQQRTRSWPGTTVGDQNALAANFQAGLDIEAWINYLLALLAIAYAAIASVNTLAVQVLARHREFAVQRLAGATRRQVTRMLLVEGAIVAVAGLGLGAVIAAFTVVPTAVAVGAIIPSGPVWVLLAAVVITFAIVWPATAIAARLAMRRSPIDAIASVT